MLIDAHAHLDRYGDELPSVLAEIAEHRVLTVSNSMDLQSYERNLKIARRCAWVLPTFGVHPWNAPEHAHRLDALHKEVKRSPMLGEIGLDHRFIRDSSQYAAQQNVFEFFLGAARDQNKIVNLHTTGAESQVLALLDHYEIRRAIIHWYSGPLDILRDLLTRGCYFTVGVEVLRSDHIRTIAREIPSDRILTETDNPGGHQWLAGAPGMPGLLDEVIEALSAVRGVTRDTLTALVWRNFAELAETDRWFSEVSESASRPPCQT